MSDPTPPGPTYVPIAVGFYLLALPLFIAVFLSDGAAGRWTNGAAGLLLVGLGLLLHRRRA